MNLWPENLFVSSAAEFVFFAAAAWTWIIATDLLALDNSG